MEKSAVTQSVINAKQESSEAFDALYKAFYSDVYFTCYKILEKHENAEDITQDSFVEAFQSIASLKEPSGFKSWINRIAINKSLDFLKRSNRIQLKGIDELNSLINAQDFEVSFETKVIENDVSETIRGIIARLPEEQRIALFLFYYSGMTTREIAELYNCPESTVKSRLQYARKFIKKEVERLEDSGYQLRCFAAIPFLPSVFSAQKAAVSLVPCASFTTVLSARRAAQSPSGIHSASNIQSAEQIETGKAFTAANMGKAATTGKSVVKMSGAIKAAIACTAVAVVTGGVITAVVIKNNKKPVSDVPYNENIVTVTTTDSDEISSVYSDFAVGESTEAVLSDFQADSKTTVEMMREYIANYFDLSQYLEDEPDVGETYYSIGLEWDGDTETDTPEIPTDITLINSIQFGIGTPYSTLRNAGYVSNYDDDEINSYIMQYFYPMNESKDKSLYVGIFNNTDSTITIKEGEIGSFTVETDDRCPDFDYNGITKSSAFEDVVTTFGAADVEIYLFASKDEEPYISLTYDNHDINRKRITFTFDFDVDSKTAALKKIKIA